jgi:hypothetical protein
VGRWLSRRREGAPGDPAPPADGEGGDRDPGAGDGDDAKDAKGRDPGANRRDARPMTGERDRGPDTLDGFPCQLGDVVIRITGEEAWLAGGLVLSEEVPVAALFVAPDAGHDCVLYARPKPRDALYWMEPLDPGTILVGGEPPTSVEHGDVRFERIRRLPLRPRRVGVGAPDAGDVVVVAEYASSGPERLVVMKSASGLARAYRGVELEPSAYEVIASGKKTLE